MNRIGVAAVAPIRCTCWINPNEDETIEEESKLIFVAFAFDRFIRLLWENWNSRNIFNVNVIPPILIVFLFHPFRLISLVIKHHWAIQSFAIFHFCDRISIASSFNISSNLYKFGFIYRFDWANFLGLALSTADALQTKWTQTLNFRTVFSTK